MTSDRRKASDHANGTTSAASKTDSDKNTAPRPFQADGWANVRDGFVLIYVGCIAAIVCSACRAVLHSNDVLAGVFWGASFLAGAAVLGGKWLCRSAPAESGLRELATAFCVFLSYAWLCSLVGAIAHWSHRRHSGLALLQGSGALAEIAGAVCFLIFLKGVASQSADSQLVGRARRVLYLSPGILLAGAFFVFLRLEQITHHVRRGNSGIVASLVLVGIGFVLSWMWQYLMLIKSLADAIETSLDSVDSHAQ